jgi:hypothetical protein
MNEDRATHPEQNDQARRGVRTGTPLAALVMAAVICILSFTARFSPAQTRMELARWREFSYAKQTNQFGSRVTAVDGLQRNGYVVLNDGTFARLSSSLVYTTSPEGKEYYQGFVMYDFEDGSSILAKVDVSGEPRTKQTGTIIFLSGLKRFKGIAGRGTISSWMPTKWDLYTEVEASYSVAQE